MYPKRTGTWLAVLALCSGCGVGGMIKGKAAKDFNCPKERVHIQSLGATTKRAIGCGQWADYRCVRTANGSTYCSMLDSPAEPPPTPEEWAHAHTPGVEDH